ncbi:MAG: hypothetical protein QF418_02760 [Candidatus Marinimicrobia bacterium]|nr:hypothetical protein [Candidatus Neomarinimicrobiota bacterium]
MNLVFTTAIIVLFTSIVWYMITPLFEKESGVSLKINQGDLDLKKQVLLRQIKELEMDHHIGNISDEDFNGSRLALKQEISEIIAELKKVS